MSVPANTARLSFEALTSPASLICPVPGCRTLMQTLEDRERQMIEEALAQSRGRISGATGAAAKLGIPRQTLDRKILSLGIDKNQFKSH